VHTIGVSGGAVGARAPPGREIILGAEFMGVSCKCTPRARVHQWIGEVTFVLCGGECGV